MTSPAPHPHPDPGYGFGATLTALTALGGAISGVASEPLWAMNNQALLAALEILTTHTHRLDAARLALIAEADTRGATTHTGAPSTTAWLRGHLQIAPGTAATHTRLATRLTDPTLADTADAHTNGHISTAHATVIARTLDSLAPTTDAEVYAQAQTTLLELATFLDPTQLRHAAVHLRATIDPATTDDLARREFEQTQTRTLTLTPTADGWTLIRGQLDPEGAALLTTAITPLAAPNPTTDPHTGHPVPDPRTAAHRRAEALIELARRALTTRDTGTRDGSGSGSGTAGQLPTTHGGQPTTLVVTLTLDNLRDTTGTATLPGGAPLSPSAARRIACHTGLIPAVLGTKSQPLDLGRATRTINPTQYRALVLRDQGCAFPGCNRPPSWTEAHHIHHWANSGTTDLNNLVLLCAYHHRHIHQYPWRITLLQNGHPQFTPP